MAIVPSATVLINCRWVVQRQDNVFSPFQSSVYSCFANKCPTTRHYRKALWVNGCKAQGVSAWWKDWQKHKHVHTGFLFPFSWNTVYPNQATFYYHNTYLLLTEFAVRTVSYGPRGDGHCWNWPRPRPQFFPIRTDLGRQITCLFFSLWKNTLYEIFVLIVYWSSFTPCACVWRFGEANPCCLQSI